ncbi:MAG: hypothetical protein M3Y87_24505 [Myxococcota bacterium]|nr:hypothetical protein [Myxococcota bacterium]
MRADIERSSVDGSVFRAIGIISRWVVGLAVLATVVALVAWGPAVAIGAAAGGALAATEWVLSAAIARRVAASDSSRARVLWALLFVFKSVATFGSAGLCLLFLDPRGLALGFGSLIVGVIAGAIEAQIRSSSSTR